ncbi:MAG: molybdenum cofactor guanylyltransferase MobA [Pseudohongiellaceae bacterium]
MSRPEPGLKQTMIEKTAIAGVILAGGKASRMDFRDKALLHLNGEPLLAHVIRKAEPQVQQLLLSVNHNAEQYQSFELPIVGDHELSYGGPLLGIYSAMRWCLQQPDTNLKFLACFAADVPEFPQHVVTDLSAAIQDASIGAAYIRHRGQIQPLFSLWRLALADQLHKAIMSGLYGPKLVFESVHAVAVHSDNDTPGAFFNINSSTELEFAAGLIRKNNA